jgi:hypothetical protein
MRGKIRSNHTGSGAPMLSQASTYSWRYRFDRSDTGPSDALIR